MIKTIDLAKALKISRQRTTQLLHLGVIKGATWNKDYRRWNIPDDWEKIKLPKKVKTSYLEKLLEKADAKKILCLWQKKRTGIEVDPEKIIVSDTLLQTACEYLLEHSIEKSELPLLKNRPKPPNQEKDDEIGGNGGNSKDNSVH